MAEKGKFIISRLDQVGQTDDVVLESEGLTIGRLIGNDLVLNNRAVSRTHAGIKQIGSEFWIFNLSNSNGTILNGQLVARGPIADGDVVQVGPYVLRMNSANDSLRITVEMELQVQPAEGRVPETKSLSGGGMEEGTLIVDMRKAIASLKEMSQKKAMSGTGMFTGVLPVLDEQALNVFWEKRKREAGKIAAKTPLHPRTNRKVGKAQFNWYPTMDLRRAWRKSYFAWGAAIVALISIGAAFIPDLYYSPGKISSVHASNDAPVNGIAVESNGSSCSTCHAPTSTMQSQCTECHTTSGFKPTIYGGHEREGVGCIACHSEHVGQEVQAGLLSYGICSSCHNNSYKIKTGEKAGKILGIPHGGSVGYPVENGQWIWKGLSADLWKNMGQSEAVAQYTPKDQFHLLHQQGRMMGRIRCTDCHTAGVRTDEGLHKSPRNECAKCHAVSFTGNTAVRVTANCSTCHQQHGKSQDLAKLVPVGGTDSENIKKYIASLSTGGSGQDGSLPPLVPAINGGAQNIRQQRTSLGLGRLSNVGAIPWYGWIALAAILPIAGFVVIAVGTARERNLVRSKLAPAKEDRQSGGTTRSIDLQRLKEEGPAYPHPVIDTVLCIGCHACVEACPHDVLAIVNGVSTPVALDQCMEDTSCQVECPTSPKACVVINTTKVIPPRKVPTRNTQYLTNVEGIYLIGDVSGVPLIKNAVNEGAQVVDFIVEDLNRDKSPGRAEYDLAVIGIGPAGLSATAIAKQCGLTVVAIEQDQVVSTIQAYPSGKYVFFKPDTVQAKGGVPLGGAGDTKEAMLGAWLDIIKKNNLQINEGESCVDIKKEDSAFKIVTEKGKAKTPASYTAKRVILAIGNRGTPMKLRVPGEEIRINVVPDPEEFKSCHKCKFPRRDGQQFCPKCGTRFEAASNEPRPEPKVKYKLLDPDDFRGKKVIVVGAGNSAIEAAVDLAGFKREGGAFKFVRDNEVTLVIRSDFKGDLKLGNKMNVYDCIDAGKIKVYYQATIKEIKGDQVILMNARSKEEIATMQNDFVFALIGGEKPTKFLESLGIKIGE